MAKTVIQLGLEGRSLRGIRLENDGEKTECSDAVLGANDPAQLEELNRIAKAKGYTI